ncbi:pentatricopeptide repeat-containing protein [Iris pallida]|uniref:Pentatricopeptide repeat-containing protein n=2 Tax=Iris pallida TaxID=29817 RepID=A0AAX6E142_IRIPA|nr:pentatricopeptide repeat-containing protein [Iris pallida]
MNAVMEACVRCGDLDSAMKVFDEMSKRDGCGVDRVSYGILLKGFGEAGRIDEAFHILESVEKGAAGSLKLSPALIYGLLNTLLQAGKCQNINDTLHVYYTVTFKYLFITSFHSIDELLIPCASNMCISYCCIRTRQVSQVNLIFLR